MIQIYHNPRCGKSRSCLAFLNESDLEYETISYLTEIPSFDDLKTLLHKLKIEPIQLVRIKEKIWIEKYKGKQLSDTEIIQAMADNPILIERPIVIKDDKAVIGREVDKVASFLK